MFFQNINYWVVVVATVVGMIVGFIWYAPWAFGRLLAKSKQMPAEKPRARTWIGMTVSTFVTAFVLAALFNSLVIVGFWGLILAALLLWLGFAVPMKLGDYYFGGDSLAFFLISVGHELAVVVVMSIIVGIF